MKRQDFRNRAPVFTIGHGQGYRPPKPRLKWWQILLLSLAYGFALAAFLAVGLHWVGAFRHG